MRTSSICPGRSWNDSVSRGRRVDQLTENYRVRFLPDGLEAWVPAGSTLLAAAAVAHMAIDAPCGDRGICGKCKVQVLNDEAAGIRQQASGDEGRGEGEGEAPAEPRSLTHHPSLITHPSFAAPPTLHERSLMTPEELEQGWR